MDYLTDYQEDAALVGNGPNDVLDDGGYDPVLAELAVNAEDVTANPVMVPESPKPSNGGLILAALVVGVVLFGGKKWLR